MAKRVSKFFHLKKSKRKRVQLHKSFKRSYREDYIRKLNVPTISYHIFYTFKILFKNWKLFLPFLIIVIVANIIFVGLMSENVYVQFQTILDDTSASVVNGDIGNVAKAGLLLISTITTGGLNTEMSESQNLFAMILFLVIWLVTIFLLRHILAGRKISLRDALYNAGAPIISTLVVFVVAFFECVPIFLFIIAYSAAVTTNFLATPFYALVFFIFALLMFVLSGYLLSSSLMALVAVTAPGLYPLKALGTASDLMAGRRLRFIIRIITLIFVMVVTWVIVMLPIILFDIWIKQFEWSAGIPFVPFCLLAMTCFTIIYSATYLYLYYRWMLNYEEK